MINILVVDDEPISADGIAIYLAEHGDMDWNVMTSYGGLLALNHIRQRVDILVTDVMMPVCDGFTLHERMSAQWPRMKTVFLTSYPQMENAQRAIREANVVDYVLKAEPEETILAAVRKAVDLFQRELQTQDLVSKAREDIKAAQPLLRKELLSSILKQKIDPKEPLADRFRELELPLRPDWPVLLLLVQLGPVTQQDHGSDLAAFTLDNIMEKYLWPVYKLYAIQVDSKRIVYFIQSSISHNEESVRKTFSLLEGVRETYHQAIGLISLVLDHHYCRWDEAGQHYLALIHTLERNLQLDEDLLLQQSDEDKPAEAMPHLILFELRSLLEHGEYERAAVRLQQMEWPHTPQGRIDLYRRLLKLYMLTVSARDDAESLYQDCRLPSLMLDEAGWERTISSFAALFASLSRLGDSSPQRLNNVVAKVKEYVHDHLADDLSLTKMADITGRSTSNLSKVFKQATGVGYNEYIVKQRMKHAAAMLLNQPNMRLNDIAEAVGYSTPSYFIRVFRENYGMTPSEYRRSK